MMTKSCTFTEKVGASSEVPCCWRLLVPLDPCHRSRRSDLVGWGISLEASDKRRQAGGRCEMLGEFL
jgi:hypothetical protein